MTERTQRANRRRRWWLRARTSLASAGMARHKETAAVAPVAARIASRSELYQQFARDQQVPSGVSLELRRRWWQPRLHIPLNEPLLIVGRSSECGCCLNDPQIESREVAYLWVRGLLVRIDLTARGQLVTVLNNTSRDHFGPWQACVQGLPIQRDGSSINQPVRTSPTPTAQTAPIAPTAAEDEESSASSPQQVFMEWSKNLRRKPSEIPMGLTLVGRSPLCGISLPESSLAPVQAAILRTERALWLVDLAGNQQALLHGRLVELEPLDPGDEIQWGTVSGRIRLTWPSEVATATVEPATPVPATVAATTATATTATTTTSNVTTADWQQFLLAQSARLSLMQQRLADLLAVPTQPEADDPAHYAVVWQHFRQLAAECEAEAQWLTLPSRSGIDQSAAQDPAAANLLEKPRGSFPSVPRKKNSVDRQDCELVGLASNY